MILIPFEPVASVGVGPAVSQPVNVHPLVTVSAHSPVDEKKVLDMCSSMVAKVQASGLPESAVQSLVGSMEELLNDIHTRAKEAVVECLSSGASNKALKQVENCFEQLENAFSCLNTESKRRKHFEEKWQIVEPVEYILAVRFDMRRDKTTASACQ